MLQLGHAGEGVEITVAERIPSHRPALQLGHAGEGVEIGREGSGHGQRVVLQLGHAGEGVEIPTSEPAQAIAHGFNWATPVKAWRLGGTVAGT